MNRLLEDPAAQELLERYPRDLVRRQLDMVLDAMRNRIRAGEVTSGEEDAFVAEAVATAHLDLDRLESPVLRRVVNATGVIVFTNAGRAPLAGSAAEHAAMIGAGYSNLEYDLSAGTRGRRDSIVEARLRSLAGCEAATVCNNAAAALLLILNTLADGRPVVVSRGELVEIGGSFRLPSVMERSGARLREVGTTNRTRIADYREAVDFETALILKVHPSNFRIVGFTQSPEVAELVALSKETGVPLVFDVGSGLLTSCDLPWLRDEPPVREILGAGVDLVCFSGDKLLGGPQAGLILGRRDLVDRIRRNPLMRALRVDKLVYAALDRTLALYQTGRAEVELPVWRMLRMPAEEVRERAKSVCRQIAGRGFKCRLVEDWSLPGGGSAPEERIPSWTIRLSHPEAGASVIEARLRGSDPPVLVRIEGSEVVLDLRTVLPGEETVLVRGLAAVAAGLSGRSAGPGEGEFGGEQ